MSGYTHYIIRFEKDSVQLNKDEQSRYVEEFKSQWEDQRSKSENWSIAVYHTYEAGQEKDKRNKCGATTGHIHIVYKAYKGSSGQKFIREFCKRRQLRLYERAVERLLGIAKYLLQGNGREILYEAGKGRPNGLQDRSAAIHKEQESYGYNLGSESEGHESDWSSCEEDRKSCSSKNGGRKAKTIRKETGACMEELTQVETIKELLLKYRVKDEPNLKRKMTDKEKQIFKEIMFTSGREWTKVWSTAREEAMTSVMDSWWEDILKTLPDEGHAYSPPVMSVNKSLKVITAILDAQGWDKEQRKQFLCDVYSVMNNNKLRKKRNTLYLIGKTSAGKTLIATSLELSKIFSFSSGEYNSRTSDFHFEDMATACIAILNEPQIEPGKVDKFKVILEGGAFDTNVKFKSKSRVEGVPVIVTTNTEIYRYAPEAAEPFEERIYRWTFRKKLSHIDISGGLHPKMWLTLIKAYDLHKDIFKDDSDDEFDISQFGGQVVAPQQNYVSDESDEEAMHIESDPDEGTNPNYVGCQARWKAWLQNWGTDDNAMHHDPMYFTDEIDFYAYAFKALGPATTERVWSIYFGFAEILREFGTRDADVTEHGIKVLRGLATIAATNSSTIWKSKVLHPDNGAIEQALCFSFRVSIRDWIISVFKYLDEHHSTLAEWKGSDVELINEFAAIRSTKEKQRALLLQAIRSTRAEANLQDLRQGWEYPGSPARESSDRGGITLESELRLGNKSASERYRYSRQGIVTRPDDIHSLLRRVEAEELPLFICNCGWYICHTDDEIIRYSGHDTCKEGWIRDAVYFEYQQETCPLYNGHQINAINKRTLP